MQRTVRSLPTSLTFFFVLMAAMLLPGIMTSAAQAAATYQPPALYTYGGATLSSGSRITSIPALGAAFYVKAP